MKRKKTFIATVLSIRSDANGVENLSPLRNLEPNYRPATVDSACNQAARATEVSPQERPAQDRAEDTSSKRVRHKPARSKSRCGVACSPEGNSVRTRAPSPARRRNHLPLCIARP